MKTLWLLRRKIRTFITKLRGYAWRELIQKLQEGPAAKGRWEAAEKLAYAPPEPEVITALAEALADPHPFVRWKAGEALLALGVEEAFQALLEALKNRNPAKRAAAAEVLGRWGDVRAVEPLCKALKSRNLLVRWSAAEALSLLKAPQALPCLVKAANDEAWGVRRAVALGIGSLAETADGTNFGVLESLGRDSHPMVRSAVARALGKVKHPQAEPLLISLLQDENPQVRLEAVRSLGQVGSEKALPVLQQLLQGGDETLGGAVSEAAQKAAGAIRRRLLLARFLTKLNPGRGKADEAGGPSEPGR